MKRPVGRLVIAGEDLISFAASRPAVRLIIGVGSGGDAKTEEDATVKSSTG